MSSNEQSNMPQNQVTNGIYGLQPMNPYYMPYGIQYNQRNLRKLFVGQIPKTYTEADVINIFSDTCKVHNAHIIKDKVTGEHKGCAFIYVDPSVAETVKETYHNKYTCPKMTNRLQVRDANTNQNAHYPNSRYNPAYHPQPILQIPGNLDRAYYPVPTVSQPMESTNMPNNQIDSNTNTNSNVSSQPTNPAVQSTPSMSSPVIANQEAYATPGSPSMMQQYQGIYPMPMYTMYPSGMMMQTYPSYQTISPMIIQPVGSEEEATEPAANPKPISSPNYIIPSQFPMMVPSIPGYNNYIMPMTVQQADTTEISTNESNTQQQYMYPAYNESIPVMMPVETPYYTKNQNQSYNEHYSNQKERSSNANLFVFNIPASYNDDNLRKLFEKYGKINSCKVMYDTAKGTSKCYGFVNFDKEEEAAAAIAALHNHIIGDKKLTVEVKKAKR